MQINTTEVFDKNWKAIHELLEDEDGNNVLDEYGVTKRKYRYIINTGSSRSSKTWSIFQCLYLYVVSNKLKRVTVLRDVAKHCRELVENEFIDWTRDPMGRISQLQKGEISQDQFVDLVSEECLTRTLTRNKSNHTHTTTTESTILFSGADSVDGIIGKTQSALWINEPYQFDQKVFHQLDQRTSEFIVIDWNPKQKHWIDELSRQPNAIVIHSTYKENPFCPTEMATKIDSYEPTPQNIARGTADDYMWQVYGLGLKAEKPNKIYKGWKEIDYVDFQRLPYQSYYGVDFGIMSPTAIVECKYNEGSFYFNQILYKSENEMKDQIISELGIGYQEILKRKGLSILTYFLNKCDVSKGKDVLVCDSADRDPKTETRKIIELAENNYIAIPFSKTGGSVLAGISLLQRANVYLTTTSADMWEEYELYEWEIIKGVNLERPVKKQDHSMDAGRYISSWLKLHLGINL